jgi:hypothetical protein
MIRESSIQLVAQVPQIKLGLPAMPMLAYRSHGLMSGDGLW